MYSLKINYVQVLLQSWLTMACNCISQNPQLWPPSASLGLHGHGLHVDLQPGKNSASMCISQFNQSESPSASPKALDHGLHVHLPCVTVIEVDWVTGSIYSGDPRVDRHHLIFISFYHTMKIHILSFLTFGLNHCFQDFVNPCDRIVSYLPILLLCSSSYKWSFSWIPLEYCERCARVLVLGPLSSSSITSLQRPPIGASLSSLNGCH